MARIRTIKPDFFTSEDIISLTPLARLLYIGLWCEADREGRLAWRPVTFKIRYLPADEVDIDKLCKELLDREMIVLYGDRLAHIPSFLTHQHINPRESASTFPVPTKAKTIALVTRASRDSDAQVGRKEGKEGNTRDACVEILAYLNEKAGKAFQETKTNLKFIAARLENGATQEQCKAVIDAKSAQWKNDPKMREYLRPATLFNGEKFDQYAGEIGSGGTDVPIWERS